MSLSFVIGISQKFAQRPNAIDSYLPNSIDLKQNFDPKIALHFNPMMLFGVDFTPVLSEPTAVLKTKLQKKRCATRRGVL